MHLKQSRAEGSASQPELLRRSLGPAGGSCCSHLLLLLLVLGLLLLLLLLLQLLVLMVLLQLLRPELLLCLELLLDGSVLLLLLLLLLLELLELDGLLLLLLLLRCCCGRCSRLHHLLHWHLTRPPDCRGREKVMAAQVPGAPDTQEAAKQSQQLGSHTHWLVGFQPPLPWHAGLSASAPWPPCPQLEHRWGEAPCRQPPGPLQPLSG